MQQPGQQQRQQRYTGGKQRTHLQKDGSAHYTECGALKIFSYEFRSLMLQWSRLENKLGLLFFAL